jgi:Mg2+-importing ATPase
LLWTTVAVAALAIALPFLGPFARVFGFVAPTPGLLAASVAIVAGYAVVTELAKRRFYRPSAVVRRGRVRARRDIFGN